MNVKLTQWGALLAVYGIAALILPHIGVQLKIFNLLGENSHFAAIGSVVLGGLMLVIGKATGGSSAAHAASVPQGAAPPPVPPSGSSSYGQGTAQASCPSCGAAATPGDQFCMNCGASLAAPAPAAAPPLPPQQPAPKKGGCGMVLLILLLLIGGGIAWFFFGGSLASYTPPPRSEPAVPQRMAGTLTEFPVDPAATNPMTPTTVVSQTFDPGGKGGSTTVDAPPESLPPGLEKSAIPQVATAMTSTTYKSDPASTPVHVHVMQSPSGVQTAGQIAQSVAQGTGGNMQGTRVQSPNGQAYNGYSVRSANVLVFVLVNPAAGNVIILYTPQASGFDSAQRLAGSVGNGRGLADYPQIANTYGVLPASAPPGYGLNRMTNFTGGEITSALNKAQSQMSAKDAETINKTIQSFRPLIPDSGTFASYRNSSGQEKGVLVGSYGSPRRASVAWRIISWTLGWLMKKTSFDGADAYIQGDSSGKFMLIHKGPYIGFTVVPASDSDSDLESLARSLQF